MGSKSCLRLRFRTSSPVCKGACISQGFPVVALLLAFLSLQQKLTEALGPGPSLCLYEFDRTKEYPYPYNRHPWFEYVGKEISRPPPRALVNALKWENDASKVVSQKEPSSVVQSCRAVFIVKDGTMTPMLTHFPPLQHRPPTAIVSYKTITVL